MRPALKRKPLEAKLLQTARRRIYPSIGELVRVSLTLPKTVDCAALVAWAEFVSKPDLPAQKRSVNGLGKPTGTAKGHELQTTDSSHGFRKL